MRDRVQRWGLNVLWGVYWSLCVAVIFILYSVLLLLVRGNAAFEANDVTFLGTVAVYLFGGVCTGLILGTLRPLGRFWLGAAILGYLCAIPVYVAVRVAVNGFENWSREDLRMLIELPLYLGPFSGLLFKYYASKM